MASAGRILIMPKGEWNSETEYKMLDLINHNGASWLAKKTSLGMEPSIDNSEYWQKMFDGITAPNMQISTGNYTGSNSYGESNKNSLTFDFEPKIVLISTGSTYNGACIWHYGTTTIALSLTNSNTSQEINFELDNKTLKWYNASGANYQLNMGNTTYFWVAIG